MTTTTTQTPHTADQTVAVPPRMADLYQQLSAPGSRAFQDALRTLWRLGPTAIGLPATTAEPVRASWQEAGEQMAAVIREHEAAQAPHAAAQPPPAQDGTATVPDAPPTATAGVATHGEPTAGLEADFNFDAIWTDVRASIERARQALPDWSELNTTDDLKPAIDEALKYLAQTPVPRSSTSQKAGSGTLESAATSATESPNPAAATNDLNEHLAAVDAAYAAAQSTGIPADQPEWSGIAAIHSAIHNLWDTLKAVAGTYWAEVSADARLNGLMTTLATRAARAIAQLANSAADRLDQRTAQQQLGIEAAQPGLRETYINARNHIRAHATSHDWQRITALWGTVNTLTRQTNDPGIRAVVARSADAIADHADALGRKTAQFESQDGATNALTALARAAERHAANLRTTNTAPGQHKVHVQPQPTTDAVSENQNPYAQALEASARQVAQHAQARHDQAASQSATTPRRPHASGKGGVMRPMQPPTPTETVQVRIQ